MILVASDRVPLEHVIPALMQTLPLEEDFEENTTVLRALLHLFMNFTPAVSSVSPKLTHVLPFMPGHP